MCRQPSQAKKHKASRYPAWTLTWASPDSNGSIAVAANPAAAHQPGPRGRRMRPRMRPINAAASAARAVSELRRSTQPLRSPVQSPGSSTIPPRGTLRVTNWIPVKVVFALSHETVANGSRNARAARANREGESQRGSQRLLSSASVRPSFGALASRGWREPAVATIEDSRQMVTRDQSNRLRRSHRPE
jgi:hypothetical protein